MLLALGLLIPLVHCGDDTRRRGPIDGADAGPRDASLDGALPEDATDDAALDSALPGDAAEGGALSDDAGDAAAWDGSTSATCPPGSSGNPFVDGWYADPDMRLYDGLYWVYPTYSAPYDQQTFLDAFWSPDLVHWTKSPKVLDRVDVAWATRAIWAPSPIFRNGIYYLYFGANDIQNNNQVGGIGVATAASPGGPFVDGLGHPLVGQIVNGAQPIDQNVFIDDDGQAYLYYGGWGHCNVVKLNADMKSLGTFGDGSTYKEITPPGYVEGALMFKRNGTYYLMWSEGGWTGPDYRVSYAMTTSPTGPFNKVGTILSQDAEIGTGSGHNTVVNVPGTDRWYIFYHRHPLGETDGNHRVLSYDAMVFNTDGTIKPVTMAAQDKFCDGDALGWKPYGGTWTVANEQYKAAAAPEAKSFLNTHYSAMSYEADVRVGPSGDAGLVFRASNLSSAVNGYRGYYLGIDAQHDRVFLGKSSDTGWFEWRAVSRVIDPNVVYHLNVVVNARKIDVLVDGGLLFSTSDSMFDAGATGILAHDTAASFTNVALSLPPGAVFYQDGGYGGVGVALLSGTYTLAQLNDAGVPNNWASSVRVPEGWTVDLYQDDNLGGKTWRLTADTPILPADANDQLTSVKIAHP